MHRTFGLIGKTLTHSFSKKYFTEKFEKENITDCEYLQFELNYISQITDVFKQKNLCGLNVTIPYKQDIIKYLDELNEEAKEIGAINTVKFIGTKKIGYNTDIIGFENTLLELLENNFNLKALVLGNGGAAKAVKYVLTKLNIEYLVVTRNEINLYNFINYDNINADLIIKHKLIINTTPLGMHPNIETYPNLPYEALSEDHYLYDLVYNPLETEFIKKGKKQKAKTMNGLKMLYGQAEASWKIWNS